MKQEHLEQLEKKLSGALPKINALLAELGLPDFFVHSMEIGHRDDPICKPPCGDDEVCDQKLVGNKFIPFCRPRRLGE